MIKFKTLHLADKSGKCINDGSQNVWVADGQLFILPPYGMQASVPATERNFYHLLEHGYSFGRGISGLDDKDYINFNIQWNDVFGISYPDEK